MTWRKGQVAIQAVSLRVPDASCRTPLSAPSRAIVKRVVRKQTKRYPE
jgi:hypothetical protein